METHEIQASAEAEYITSSLPVSLVYRTAPLQGQLQVELPDSLGVNTGYDLNMQNLPITHAWTSLSGRRS
jgi:hypothetical protein